jgi:hypothetical protein
MIYTIISIKIFLKIMKTKYNFCQIENLATGDNYFNIFINNILHERKKFMGQQSIFT